MYTVIQMTCKDLATEFTIQLNARTKQTQTVYTGIADLLL